MRPLGFPTFTSDINMCLLDPRTELSQMVIWDGLGPAPRDQVGVHRL